MRRTNWAGNYEYRAARLHRPRTVDELREVVHRAARVKVLGTRHAFNDIADTDGDHVSMEHFDRVLAIEPTPEGARVTVEGGVTYGRLCRRLRKAGCALGNLASLPHISVAGACATATHGSGIDNGNLATAVRAMQIVTADAEIIDYSREADGNRFNGVVVSLGALGVVTRLTLDAVPAYDVRQEVFENYPLEEVTADFDGVMSAAYSVSLFTDWRQPRFNQVWLKHRAGDARGTSRDMTSRGATPATRNLHPISTMPAENCTPQMNLPGPSDERLPHFRMEFTPSAGEELQSEYFVPRHHAADALRAIEALRAQIAPLLQICEVRTIAADELWMSPCYRQPCAAIHFTWKKDWPGVRALLPAIERALAAFEPRPHWGKLFALAPAEMARRYPRLVEFRELAKTYDPIGKFRNAYLDRYVLP